ncbi:MAG: hypothetical protein A2Z83_01685 [Omnitrophica bacterium GWA2_52_8]|nr:MAG: hypothetical protein A2Z83_01685 [Omnitrophica bacterium GWA2_52_8]
MTYIPKEKLVKGDQSLYKTVLALAARANELAQGAQPLVKSESKKVSTIAMEEFAAGKIRYEIPKTKGKKAAAI